MKSPVKLLLAVGVGYLLAAPPAPAAAEGRFGGEPTRVREATAAVAAGGRAVRVENTSGNVTVRAGGAERVAVEARVEYWSDDEEWMARVEREFRVEVTEETGRITLRPHLPEVPKLSGFRRRLSYAVDLVVSVPRGTRLEANDAYGDVSVTGVGGPAVVACNAGNVAVSDAVGEVSIDSRYGNAAAHRIDGPLTVKAVSGNVELDAVGGPARIEASYGSVRASGLRGELRVVAGSGNVTLADVAGRVEVEAKYGDVEAGNLAGAVTVSSASGSVRIKVARQSVVVRSSYGDVEVADVSGPVTLAGSSGNATVRRAGAAVAVDASYGDVVVEEARGDVRVASASGGVTLTGIGGDAEVRSSYGAVRARAVAGGLSVTGASTEVRAEDVGGPISVETTYGGVELRGVRDAVSVRAQSGSVRVAGFSGRALAAAHDLASSYGDVEVSWPRSAPVAARLETADGTIESELPGRTREQGSGRVFETAAAAGGATLRVSARGGSVVLELE